MKINPKEVEKEVQGYDLGCPAGDCMHDCEVNGRCSPVSTQWF